MRHFRINNMNEQNVKLKYSTGIFLIIFFVFFQMVFHFLRWRQLYRLSFEMINVINRRIPYNLHMYHPLHLLCEPGLDHNHHCRVVFCDVLFLVDVHDSTFFALCNRGIDPRDCYHSIYDKHRCLHWINLIIISGDI